MKCPRCGSNNVKTHDVFVGFALAEYGRGYGMEYIPVNVCIDCEWTDDPTYQEEEDEDGTLSY